MSAPTPAEVLACTTPAAAAKKFYEWLKANHDAADAVLWAPQRAAEFGCGEVWAVCWEGAPFEWAPAVSMGASVYAGELDDYSKPGPFPKGLFTEGWHSEPWNNFILCFYPTKTLPLALEESA